MLEYAIHVTVEYRHVSVQVAHGVIAEEFEDAELRPGIGESFGDEPGLDVCRWEQEIDFLEDEIQWLFLHLKGSHGGFRDAGSIVHHQGVPRAMFAESVSQDNHTSEVATTGD